MVAVNQTPNRPPTEPSQLSPGPVVRATGFVAVVVECAVNGTPWNKMLYTLECYNSQLSATEGINPDRVAILVPMALIGTLLDLGQKNNYANQLAVNLLRQSPALLQVPVLAKTIALCYAIENREYGEAFAHFATMDHILTYTGEKTWAINHWYQTVGSILNILKYQTKRAALATIEKSYGTIPLNMIKALVGEANDAPVLVDFRALGWDFNATSRMVTVKTPRVAEIKKAADRFTTGRLHLAWVIDGVYGLERNSPAVRFFASSDP